MLDKELGYNQIIFEGDAKLVIQAVNDARPSNSYFGHFVEGIQVELNSLEYASFMHVPREANGIVHELAKLATTHVTDST